MGSRLTKVQSLSKAVLAVGANKFQSTRIYSAVIKRWQAGRAGCVTSAAMEISSDAAMFYFTASFGPKRSARQRQLFHGKEAFSASLQKCFA